MKRPFIKASRKICWVPMRSDTNRAVQPQKMARGLKFLIWEVEGFYFLYGENKGTD